MTDGLTERDRQGILSVLEASPKITRALLFGSRAIGTFRGASDLDLALEGDDLKLTDLVTVKSRIGRLGLPFEADIIIRSKISNQDMEKHIRQFGRLFYERSRVGSGLSSWKQMTLQDAGVSVIDCDHRTPPPSVNGYPYIAIPQIKHGHLDLSNVRRITREDFLDWTRKARPQPHDVILSRRCNPGETAVVPHGLDCALGQNLVLLRADESKMFPPFLRWLVRGEHWWEQVGKFINVGAVFESLRCADIPNFELPIPPLPEQRAIASILGSLDDKIELNRRMNETLEALAQTLFKSWFIDPTRNGLPKGWTERALYDCADYINGAAFRNEHFSADRRGLPVIKIGELKDGINSQTKFCEIEREAKYRISSGEVLFSWSGSPDTSIDTFIWTEGDGWLNQHIFKIQFKQSLEKFFVYYLLRHLKPVFIEIARDKQTTGLGHVTAQDLKRLKVFFPTDDLLTEFNHLVQPLFQKYCSNLHESRTLAAMRDALLPKLISGELRALKQNKQNE